MAKLLVIQHLVHDHLHQLAGPVADAGFDVLTWCTFIDLEPPEGCDDVDAIISMGGDDSAYDEAGVAWIKAERELLERAMARGVAILGVCFGAQTLARAAGGQGFRAPRREIGWTKVEFTEAALTDPIGRALVGSPDVFQFHYDTFSLPEGAVLLAEAEEMVQVFRVGDRAWGVQFHIEADPGLIYGWIGTYLDELLDNDADPGQIESDTRRYWRRYRQAAWDVSEAFVKVVLGGPAR
jgi:GMP synthase (glutamine-hydrolysing)